MEQKEAYKFGSNDAENYDFYLGPFLFEPYGEYTAKQVTENSVNTVLELACGSGRVTGYLRKALPKNTTLWATDISNDMLAIARRKLNGQDIKFEVEDMQNLSFADNSVDIVICQFGLMFVPDKSKALGEVHRVLKPGGKCLFFTWDDTTNMPVFKLLLNDLILPYFSGEDTSYFRTPFSMYNTGQLINLLQQAGFNEAKSDNVKLPPGNVPLDYIAEGLYRKHPLGKAILTKAPEEYEAVAEKFMQGLIELYKNTPPLLSAFITTGVK